MTKNIFHSIYVELNEFRHFAKSKESHAYNNVTTSKVWLVLLKFSRVKVKDQYRVKIKNLKK